MYAAGGGRVRVLLAATAIHPDVSSEGIASGRFASALLGAGFDLRVITRDRIPDGWAPPTIPLSTWQGRSRWHTLDRALTRGTVAGPGTGGIARRAFCRLSWMLTGYEPDLWARVAAWREGLEEEARARPPDLVVTRGAGGQMEPHLALVALPDARRPQPWLAHYHDPFPRSLHPAPYRIDAGTPSRRQERIHQRILDSADLLSFPSERLRDWVLAGRRNARHTAKSVVLPHLAPGAPPQPPSSPDRATFVLAHTGTLLRQRAAGTLVAGLKAFLSRHPEARGCLRFVHVGRVHEVHRDLPAWRELAAAGNLEVRDERTTQAEALSVAAAADVLVLVEAVAPSSPFFPLKLADYLALSRPILALSPRPSVASDLLGADHPLRVDPSDPSAVLRSLSLLWDAWRAGRLSALLPPPSALATLSPLAVTSRLADALAAHGLASPRPQAS